jgi:prephenate dehydratase
MVNPFAPHLDRADRAGPPRLPRVAFQGEPGAFSELAVRTQWPDGAVPIPCPSFPDAIAHVLGGFTDFAVIPVENAIIGPVRMALDALDAAGDAVRVRAEVRIPVHLCLMALPGARLEQLQRVLSHPAALAQCRIFLARHDWLEPVQHADTAGAARDVSAARALTDAAVASDVAAGRYGLEILARGIEDLPANWTRFVVIGRA